MVKSCEAELAKASAALAAKKSNPVTVPSTPTAAAKAPVATSTPVAATKAPPAEAQPLKKLGESATQLLEKAEETTGVDQKTLLTTGIATAIGVVVGVVGSLFRKR